MSRHRNGHGREWLSSRAAPITAHVARGRFTGLLVFLLTMAVVGGTVRDSQTRDVLISVAFFLLLVFAILSVTRRLRFVTATLGFSAVVAHWSLHFEAYTLPRTMVFGLTTAFLAFLTQVVLLSVLRDEAVTADTIVGAVCAYFLLGVTWGTGYALLALNAPDSFAVSPGLVAAAGWGPPTSPFVPLLEYYSMTTLSSLGFGDVSPITGAARTLSAFEGAVGQVYMAVLIARLVGIHTARRAKD